MEAERNVLQQPELGFSRWDAEGILFVKLKTETAAAAEEKSNKKSVNSFFIIDRIKEDYCIIVSRSLES